MLITLQPNFLLILYLKTKEAYVICQQYSMIRMLKLIKLFKQIWIIKKYVDDELDKNTILKLIQTLKS